LGKQVASPLIAGPDHRFQDSKGMAGSVLRSRHGAVCLLLVLGAIKAMAGPGENPEQALCNSTCILWGFKRAF
jgi:hypothetical protein